VMRKKGSTSSRGVTFVQGVLSQIADSLTVRRGPVNEVIRVTDVLSRVACTTWGVGWSLCRGCACGSLRPRTAFVVLRGPRSYSP